MTGRLWSAVRGLLFFATHHGLRTTDVTELSCDDPCILFALRRESRDFRREFPLHQRFPGAPCRASFAGPSWLTVLLVETGLGTERTTAALQWLLASPLLGNLPYRPKLVLSAGFGGGLRDGLTVGEVILADEVMDTQGRCWPTTWPGELPAGDWRPPLHRGRLLTVQRLAATAEEKQALRERYGALAVDMESAAVARLCSARGVPFGCVRAVSDDAHTSLSPGVVSLLRDGRASVPRVLAQLAASPRTAAEWWRLARHTRLAAQHLGQALGELLTLTLPWATNA